MLHVLHHDDRLLAAVKPAGLPAVPDASEDPSLIDLVRAYLSQAGDPDPFVGVVHRIDRPVSGLVLLALTSEAAADLSDQLREHQVRKTYWAVAEGIPRKEQGELTQWLHKDEARNLVRSVAPESRGARKAVTRWRVLMTLGERALIEFLPLTGRSHQLRVASARLGCPLVGDVKYGASRLLNDRSIGLHARRLQLRHPADGSALDLTAPLPAASLWNLARRHLDASR